MLFLLASLALADIAPPLGTVPTPCDISRCPEGTARTEWCVTTLGKLPDCPDTEGWERACLEKAGLSAKHLMCAPIEAKASEPKSSEPEVEEAPSSSGPCGTTPGSASGALWMLAVLGTRRRLTTS